MKILFISDILIIFKLVGNYDPKSRFEVGKLHFKKSNNNDRRVQIIPNHFMFHEYSGGIFNLASCNAKKQPLQENPHSNLFKDLYFFCNLGAILGQFFLFLFLFSYLLRIQPDSA